MNWTNDSRALARLKEIDCFLLDMDGTFCLGEDLLDGSLDVIRALSSRGKRFLFLTNNSSHDARFYKKRLRDAGCDIQRSDILTSGQAAANMLNRLHPGARVYVLGNEYLKDELNDEGVMVVSGNYDVLLAGFDTTLTYDKLATFCDGVRDGKPYYATHPDFNCPVPGGFLPDLGSMMAMIKASTGRGPDAVAGKPNKEMISAAEKRTGISAGRMAICGDRLYTDIAMGTLHGLLSVLVLTGEGSEEDIGGSKYKPDLVFARLADMMDYL